MTGLPLLIGLSGPIGCGKSTVARMLSAQGAVIIDADVLAREVTAPGTPALVEIRTRFGDEVFADDGSLDRAALARVVFNDSSALADLEAIVHPRVREAIEHRLAEAATAHVAVVALEAIKLVEGGLAERCDEAWLVECSPATQRDRLRARGAGEDDAQRRLRAQGADLVERLSRALESGVRTRRLSTEGSLDETRRRVEEALADALARR